MSPNDEEDEVQKPVCDNCGDEPGAVVVSVTDLDGVVLIMKTLCRSCAPDTSKEMVKGVTECL